MVNIIIIIIVVIVRGPFGPEFRIELLATSCKPMSGEDPSAFGLGSTAFGLAVVVAAAASAAGLGPALAPAAEFRFPDLCPFLGEKLDCRSA